MKNTIYIETYGCQMNEADTNIIRKILTDHNFVFTDNKDNARIILLNTCSVRDNADRKEFNRVKYLKYKNPNLLIGILGCLATSAKEKLLDKKLDIDFFVGPDNYLGLPEIINKVLTDKEKTYDISISGLETYEHIYAHGKNELNAWIPIMRGCNNFCSYCVVPYARGPERSRNFESIIKEITRLAEENCTQVTLLGQNVNSYNDNGHTFAELLEKVSEIKNIERIRFVSPHPKDLSSKVIEIMAAKNNICKQIHLPLQSGSTRILKMMNRTYTKNDFLSLVSEIRKTIPDIVLTTDIIVGFPTETDADFKDTVEVFKKAAFDSAFIFKYSPRPQTFAAENYEDDVPEAIKTKRIVKLNQIQKEFSLKKNKAHIGQIHKVLVEAVETKRNKNEFLGRNDGHKIVVFPKGNYRVGDYLNIKITAASANSLRGIVC
ncbi:tRNA (N6-isopentenyl adenosine(37)-C2)-methylthiotransferase MiaB [Candidatus Margulisiibacteriota bacterium]